MAQAETPHAAPGRGVHRHPCNTCGCLVWGHFLYSRSQLNEDDGRLRPAPGLCVLHTGSASGTARPWCVLFPAPFRTQALTVGRSCGAPSHGLLLPGHAFLPLPVPMSVPRPLLPLPPQACGEHPVLGASSFPPAALLHLVRGMEAAGNFHFIIEELTGIKGTLLGGCQGAQFGTAPQRVLEERDHCDQGFVSDLLLHWCVRKTTE
ncbi:uncharacterized protein LOC104854393 isoform X2 [Fukomys damarensis]|uniref:uncharacterized protein LOC104854393 isoform X2 n=1 Tax=Fukomys damarensis TaxID=885580 RepID=UPI0008FF25D1|nr:uncharacterized protein LOC104854393 isoform X2 [Fukomys damarensis]